MKVEFGKKYRLRNGSEYNLLAMHPENVSANMYSVYGETKNKEGFWADIKHTMEGSYWLSSKTASDFDLIEVSKYEDIKIDDPVIVTDGANTERRHFAGVDKDGLPLAWPKGFTSFTKGDTTPVTWRDCEPYNKEKHG